MIKKFINQINHNSSYDYEKGEIVSEISFVGDGEGDFERYSKDTTKECLVDYVKYCKEQIEIAEKCLENFKVYNL